MVFSDRPNGVGPALSALGVLGRESFAGWLPKEAMSRGQNLMASQGTDREGRGQVLADSQQLWMEMCVLHEETAGHFVPRPHHPRIPSWSPELIESLETS